MTTVMLGLAFAGLFLAGFVVGGAVVIRMEIGRELDRLRKIKNGKVEYERSHA